MWDDSSFWLIVLNNAFDINEDNGYLRQQNLGPTTVYNRKKFLTS
jgi:hypothetical protein